MNTYKKNDLKRTYQWKTTEDNPALRGKPDSSLFSRHEGWEVLYLANRFAEKRNLLDKHHLHKLEDLLAERLPADTRSQERVYKWLDENW